MALNQDCFSKSTEFNVLIFTASIGLEIFLWVVYFILRRQLKNGYAQCDVIKRDALDSLRREVGEYIRSIQPLSYGDEFELLRASRFDIGYYYVTREILLRLYNVDLFKVSETGTNPLAEKIIREQGFAQVKYNTVNLVFSDAPISSDEFGRAVEEDRPPKSHPTSYNRMAFMVRSEKPKSNI